MHNLLADSDQTSRAGTNENFCSDGAVVVNFIFFLN